MRVKDGAVMSYGREKGNNNDRVDFFLLATDYQRHEELSK